MKTRELIRQLTEADPSGELEVCVQNVDIHFVTTEPAYYDGSLQVLVRDSNERFYDIVGAKYVRRGDKVVIHPLSIADAIRNDPDMPIDYSELSPERQVSAKAAHDQYRRWYADMKHKMEREEFVRWATEKANALTEDTEDFGAGAGRWYDAHLSPNDPLPEGGVAVGQSYNSARRLQWDARAEVVLSDGFLTIRKRK